MSLLRRPRVDVNIPSAFEYLFQAWRYKVAHGGRGSAKSWAYARALILKAYRTKSRILCVREFQTSIAESVHELLKSQIELMGLGAYFTSTDRVISSHIGSEFIFAGIRTNTTKIRSIEGVDVAWAEEAEAFSDRSWEILIPTIRKPGSEIWVSFNPDASTDPTYKRFVLETPELAKVCKVSWRDNPWFPDELRAELEYLRRVDNDAYMHVWEGECRKASRAQVMYGKCVVEGFETSSDWDGPYFGADWGFSQDPTTLVKCWIFERSLYIEHEAYGVGVDIDATPAMFDKVPGSRLHAMRADNARPETISYMQRHGYPRCTGVEKWSGSVEDGIAHLRSYEKIIIHPRCKHAQMESRLYAYKQDRLTGDVLPDVIDKHNHIWDAVRYALAPLIRRKGMGFFDMMKSSAEAAAAAKAAAATNPGA